MTVQLKFCLRSLRMLLRETDRHYMPAIRTNSLFWHNFPHVINAFLSSSLRLHFCMLDFLCDDLLVCIISHPSPTPHVSSTVVMLGLGRTSVVLQGKVLGHWCFSRRDIDISHFQNMQIFIFNYLIDFTGFQAYKFLESLLGGRTMQWHLYLNFSNFGHRFSQPQPYYMRRWVKTVNK
jgi:hypothetical protein